MPSISFRSSSQTFLFCSDSGMTWLNWMSSSRLNVPRERSLMAGRLLVTMTCLAMGMSMIAGRNFSSNWIGSSVETRVLKPPSAIIASVGSSVKALISLPLSGARLRGSSMSWTETAHIFSAPTSSRSRKGIVLLPQLDSP